MKVPFSIVILTTFAQALALSESGKDHRLCGGVQCPRNFRCKYDDVNPVPSCVPMENESPLCGDIKCSKGERCELVPVQCVKAPCPSVPTCVRKSAGVRCPNGDKPLSDNGVNLFCGRGTNRVYCPSGSKCVIHPTDIYAICCKTEVTADMCPNGGKPLSNTKGEKFNCDGIGPNQVDCPPGSECITSDDPNDRFSICCRTDQADGSDKCKDGQKPLVNEKGVKLFCGFGLNHVECPDGSECIADPADRFAVCCRTDKKKIRRHICKLAADPGMCDPVITRWFFNTNAKKCETFMYGCDGNKNNFETEEECKKVCE